MLGIAVGSEFLELLPGTRLEMERLNPFLQFDNQIIGDYSMPVEVKNVDVNMRNLGFSGLLTTKVPTSGFPASVWDEGVQESVGRLKIEAPSCNLNSPARGRISMYYLTGAAGFFQDIKEVKLRSADLGGNRSFPWQGYTYTGAGWWSHIHQVVNAPTRSYDYAFYPVINKSWEGSDGIEQFSTQVMNWVRWQPSPGRVQFERVTTAWDELNVIVPFPYLKFVMERAAAAVGWKVDGAILNDPDFQKITMVNFQAVDWGFITPRERARIKILGFHRDTIEGNHPANVVFNLRDHVPDVSIADFFLALKNRFGWWYEFDNRSKVIRIHELQNVIATSVKDFTLKASPLIDKKVAQKAKIFALKNEFVGEYAGGAPELGNLAYMGKLPRRSNLPAPSAGVANQVYLIIGENNYYICRADPNTPQNATTQNYLWMHYAYNVYDVVPPNTTDEILTKATTLGVEPANVITAGYASDAAAVNGYLELVPRMDFPGNWNALSYSDSSWGIHLLFYHGLRQHSLATPTNPGTYPYASSHIYDARGQQVSNWSLAFECEKFDGTQAGLYHIKWKKILESLKDPETFEFTLYLDRSEYAQLQFSDTIIVAGVKMYLTKIKSTIPYPGNIQVEAVRL